jgi:hypothetical protein
MPAEVPALAEPVGEALIPNSDLPRATSSLWTEDGSCVNQVASPFSISELITLAAAASLVIASERRDGGRTVTRAASRETRAGLRLNVRISRGTRLVS